MPPNETWKVAIGALGANKLRSFLTMFGVVVGSASIVLVVTIMLTGKRYVMAQIEAVGSNLVFAEMPLNPSVPTALSDELTPADIKAVRQAIPQVVEVAGTYDTPMTIVVGGAEHPISLIGVTEGFQRIRNLLILHGRYFDPDDMDTRGQVCLVTQDLAERFLAGDDPVGRSIRVGELSFTVIGVFRERIATFGESEIAQDSVIIPFPLMKYYAGGRDIVRTLYAQADRPEDVPAVTRQVEEVLKSRHRVGAQYHVENLSSILEVAHHASIALTVVLLLFALIALTISGVGIMNIMLVSVTQRTHEIGIRRAVGAHRREILYQFLLEAVLISGSGAAVGILLVVSLRFLTKPLLPGNFSIPISWLSVVLAFGASCLIGVLFGYLPARRAAGLLPTESLRYE